MATVRLPKSIRNFVPLLVVILALAAYSATSKGSSPGPSNPGGVLVPTPENAMSLDNPAQGGLPEGVPKQAQQFVVEKVVDGDTIWVNSGTSDSRQKIRILEIDTPELNPPAGNPECGSREAEAFARQELAVGSIVHLLADREDQDRYGRFLRYVWDSEGEFYNEKAVKLGFAKAVLYPPNDLYIERIRQAEGEARRANLGIWGTLCSL